MGSLQVTPLLRLAGWSARTHRASRRDSLGLGVEGARAIFMPRLLDVPRVALPLVDGTYVPLASSLGGFPPVSR